MAQPERASREILGITDGDVAMGRVYVGEALDNPIFCNIKTGKCAVSLSARAYPQYLQSSPISPF
jgi:hypothetical protein